MDLLAPAGDRKTGPFGPFIEEFRMTHTNFAAIGQELGLDNQGMAIALGINVRRVRDYASGRRLIPQVVSLATWALFMKPRVRVARKLLAE